MIQPRWNSFPLPTKTKTFNRWEGDRQSSNARDAVENLFPCFVLLSKKEKKNKEKNHPAGIAAYKAKRRETERSVD